MQAFLLRFASLFYSGDHKLSALLMHFMTFVRFTSRCLDCFLIAHVDHFEIFHMHEAKE